MLRFTPTAWAKLLYLCHRGDTEIGGFGVTDPADPLRIIEFITVKQLVSAVSVSFDDEAVADFFDQQVEAGRHPSQFMRVWAHTHPGDSPDPSGTDEETFARVFGGCDWAIMFILARGGQTYARLRFNVGPAGEVCLPVEVDYTQPFDAADYTAWEAEYQQNIEIESHAELIQDDLAELEALRLLAGDEDVCLDDDLAHMLAEFDESFEEEIEI